MTQVRLRDRDADLRELMDDPDCDPTALQRTYAHFRVLNRLLARWRRIYVGRIRPLLAADRVTTLLDIGCGGGDVPRALGRWASSDGLLLEITAVDPDERAHAFVAARPTSPGVQFRVASSADLIAEGAKFDIVTSNHLLHHLTADELAALLLDSERLALRLVLHSDLERSRLGYAAYAVVSRPFRHRSFIHVDGLLSIRRSYRAGELSAVAAGAWRVDRLFPSRLLLSLAQPAGETPDPRPGSTGKVQA